MVYYLDLFNPSIQQCFWGTKYVLDAISKHTEFISRQILLVRETQKGVTKNRNYN